MSGDVAIAARQLAVEAATVEVVDALAAQGIRSILLKGPATANRLYEDPNARPFRDIDLLVEDDMLERARQMLARLGFREVLAGDSQQARAAHATAWTRSGALPAAVDLHTRIYWTRDPAATWQELSRDTAELTLGDRSIEILSEPAQAFVIAAHAVQHGAVQKPRADLARALARFDDATWARAAAISARLDCEPVLAAALRLSDDGQRLVGTLGLAGVGTTTEIQLCLAGAPHTSLTLVRLAYPSSSRERVALLVRETFPTIGHMRPWRQAHGFERLPLPLCYALRIVWVCRRLPVALPAVARARADAVSRSRRARPSRRRPCRWSRRRSG